MEAGESFEDTVVRELAEETGIHVASGDLREIGTWDQPGRDPRGRYSTDAYFPSSPPAPRPWPETTTPAPPAGGPRAGRHPALMEVLLPARHIPHEHLVAGPATALRAGYRPAGRGPDRGRSRSGGTQGRSGRRGTTRHYLARRRSRVGDGDVSARVASCPPTAGHQAAALGGLYGQLLRRRRASGGAHSGGEAQ
ncbi:NUDIX domain-containing protein [Streptomyces sp. NPDC047017]|uniref:NUDIX domain-containing protein n=1 Tax=Streptomyces sp. NPDC047017 TaxID=3155024 RepID=UPI0033C73F3C